MIIYEEIKNLQKEGYREDYAKSKLGQDIVLKAIAVSGMAQNATIKGGVVMQNISKDARRATHEFHSFGIIALSPNSFSFSSIS